MHPDYGGTNQLYGDAEKYRLGGGDGKNLLIGGAGEDSFIFTAATTALQTSTPRRTDSFSSQCYENNALPPGDVLLLFGHIEGADTVLYFNGGHSLTLHGVTDWTALAAQIDYI